MPIKKIALFILLLTYLSGTFSLIRLDINVFIEVRYVLFSLFVFLIIVGLRKNNEVQQKYFNKDIIPFMVLIFLYFVIVTISFFYTVSPAESMEKYISLWFLILLICGTIFIVSEVKANDYFHFISIFFVLIGTIYAIPVLLSVLSGASRGDLLLSGPNVTTRILFFAACSSIYRFSLNKRIVYILLSIIFLSSIVLVGSRGGLVGALAVLSILFFVKKVSNPWNIKTFKLRGKLHLIPLLLGVILLIYKPVKRVFLDRFVNATFIGNEVYTSGRDIIYKDAISLIKERPLFGYGIDSFTVLTGHVYPHNLLLELIIEIGIFGGVVFIGFFIYAFLLMFTFKKSSLLIFSGLPLYMLIVQVFSGEFYDFRYFFLWIVPFLYYRTIKEKELSVFSNQSKNNIVSNI